MTAGALPATGRVASLHVHPRRAGAPLISLECLQLVAGRGIEEDHRYFGRISRSSGRPSRRQVTLIERERIAEQAAVLGLPKLVPGAVRSNMETEGIDLAALIGSEIEVGGAVLRIYEPRTPCAKMDAICEGLRELMEHGRQGVLAEVIRSGVVRVGDSIRVL